MRSRLPDVVHPLLDGRNFGHLATLMTDGTPQSTVVWVDRDGDDVLLNVAADRVKYRNILRDPHVALSVHDQENPSEYVQIRGRAEVADIDGVAHVHKLSQKYVGRDYSDIATDFHRVVIRIVPAAVHHHRHA